MADRLRKIMGQLQGRLPVTFQAQLDTPAPNAVCSSGSLEVAGWAFSGRAPLVQIVVRLDEGSSIALLGGQSRPDVAAYYRRIPAALQSGFSGNLDLTNLAPGSHTLTLEMSDATNNRHHLIRQFRFEPKAALLEPATPPSPDESFWVAIDSPRPGDLASGRLAVGGWVQHEREPVEKIEAWLGEQYLGLVHYGIARPDVKTSYPQVLTENCGFWSLLAFEPQHNEQAVVRVRATDWAGVSVEATTQVQVYLPGEPIAEIERAEWLGKQLEVMGWAVWPHLRPPAFARFFIDDKFIGQSRLRLSRPDLADRFPTYPTASHSGFSYLAALPTSPQEGDPQAEVTVEFADAGGSYGQRTLRLHHQPGPDLLKQSFDVSGWNELLQQCRERTGEEPAVADWSSGLPLATALPQAMIFSPPQFSSSDSPSLPYLDKTVDLVVVGATNPAQLAEARRVAREGVVIVDSSSGPGPVGWRVEWLPQAAPPPPFPSVSIIIAAYNGVELTEACLVQVVATIPLTLPVEILVMDDATTDATPQMLDRWVSRDSRIKTVRNPQNLGFIGSCNRGGELAQGQIVIFLNNDTLPQTGWLEPLVEVLQTVPTAGAVGGKLIYPDGRLQEAGGVIFSNGTAYNFGRDSFETGAPLFNYRREVDYCSGALLATWRMLFLATGGFDTRYVPMYYEDADYCLWLWSQGRQVFYQPASVVIHHEGGTAGRDSNQGSKVYQELNRVKFTQKWAEQLPAQPPPPASFDPATLHSLLVREQARQGVLVPSALLPGNT